jgi:hypothetical protein
LLIGQLEGGNTMSCNNPYDRTDYYGKFAYSWTNNNSPDSNRLDYWLAPLGLGVETLEGMAVYLDTIPNEDGIKTLVKQENIIQVFPNPTTGELRITLSALPHEGGEIQIFNVMGQTLMTLKTLGTIETIDISHLAKGMYFLKVQTENGVFVKKVVKR